MGEMQITLYVSILFSILGLFLVANGLNGFLVFDEYNKPTCESAQECSANEVCCLFVNKTSGACMSQDVCKQFLAMPTKTIDKPISPIEDVSIIKILSGLLIIVITGFILYYANKSELNKTNKIKI